MRAEQALEIIESQPDSRRAFDYALDSYAPRLLTWAMDAPATVKDLRSGRFGKLLARPNMAALVSTLGGGVISPDDLIYAETLGLEDFELAQNYAIDLETWGQRKGKSRVVQGSGFGVNLVVTLNFTGRHDALYHRILQPRDSQPFAYFAHPGNKSGRNTLAWARVDLNLNTGEALIEEVQNDWLRFAQHWLEHAKQNGGIVLNGRKIPASRVGRYVNAALRPHRKLWMEAMLTATLRVLVEDIGIRSIFMHEYATGTRLKGMCELRGPPRSLYTDLPKKFCFQIGETLPDFMETEQGRRMDAMRKQKPLSMWQLDLTQGSPCH